jgi:uncharacterized membrane protein
LIPISDRCVPSFLKRIISLALILLCFMTYPPTPKTIFFISSCYFGAHLGNTFKKIKRIIFNVDNQAVVAIINRKFSKFNRVMTLVKSFLLSLQYNIMLK